MITTMTYHQRTWLFLGLAYILKVQTVLSACDGTGFPVEWTTATPGVTYWYVAQEIKRQFIDGYVWKDYLTSTGNLAAQPGVCEDEYFDVTTGYYYYLIHHPGYSVYDNTYADQQMCHAFKQFDSVIREYYVSLGGAGILNDAATCVKVFQADTSSFLLVKYNFQYIDCPFTNTDYYFTFSDGADIDYCQRSTSSVAIIDYQTISLKSCFDPTAHSKGQPFYGQFSCLAYWPAEDRDTPSYGDFIAVEMFDGQYQWPYCGRYKVAANGNITMSLYLIIKDSTWMPVYCDALASYNTYGDYFSRMVFWHPDELTTADTTVAETTTSTTVITTSTTVSPTTTTPSTTTVSPTTTTPSTTTVSPTTTTPSTTTVSPTTTTPSTTTVSSTTTTPSTTTVSPTLTSSTTASTTAATTTVSITSSTTTETVTTASTTQTSTTSTTTETSTAPPTTTSTSTTSPMTSTSTETSTTTTVPPTTSTTTTTPTTPTEASTTLPTTVSTSTTTTGNNTASTDDSIWSKIEDLHWPWWILAAGGALIMAAGCTLMIYGLRKRIKPKVEDDESLKPDSLPTSPAPPVAPVTSAGSPPPVAPVASAGLAAPMASVPPAASAAPSAPSKQTKSTPIAKSDPLYAKIYGKPKTTITKVNVMPRFRF